MLQSSSTTTRQMPKAKCDKKYNITYNDVQINVNSMSWTRAREYQDECIKKYGYCPSIKLER